MGRGFGEKIRVNVPAGKAEIMTRKMIIIPGSGRSKLDIFGPTLQAFKGEHLSALGFQQRCQFLCRSTLLRVFT